MISTKVIEEVSQIADKKRDTEIGTLASVVVRLAEEQNDLLNLAEAERRAVGANNERIDDVRRHNEMDIERLTRKLEELAVRVNQFEWREPVEAMLDQLPHGSRLVRLGSGYTLTVPGGVDMLISEHELAIQLKKVTDGK